MTIKKTPIDGLLILRTDKYQDERGSFVKLFNHDFVTEHGLDTDFKEFYYSVNRKNVVRGMHFQTPPCDHSKLVYVSQGKIRDVIVDLRKESPTYGQWFSIDIDADSNIYIYTKRNGTRIHLFRGQHDCKLCADELL